MMLYLFQYNFFLNFFNLIIAKKIYLCYIIWRLQHENHNFTEWKMKKFIAVLLILASSMLFAAEPYRVLVLGDLHYDSPDVRAGGKVKGVPRREMMRNVAAWKENIPAMLNAAALYANGNCLFSVQCGDLTQGDEGSYEMAVKSFNNALTILKSGHNNPVYVVRGNHDVRGSGKAKASAAIKTFMQQYKELKFSAHKDQVSYRMAGKDLFVFFDSQSGTALASLKEILAKVQNFRYMFVFSHLPIMPTISVSNWLCYRGKAASQAELQALLAKHNAIVLAAHTHRSQVTYWKLPEGSVTQVISFSIVSKITENFAVEEKSGAEHFKYIDEIISRKKGAARENIRKYLAPYRDKMVKKATFVANGFNVLKISDNGVEMDIFTGSDLSKPAGTLKLR